MKVCTNCYYHDRAATQIGNGQMGMVDICRNLECCNPVDGSPMPCVPVRQNDLFCGIRGRFFKQKDPEPKASSSEEVKENVIQLIK